MQRWALVQFWRGLILGASELDNGTWVPNHFLKGHRGAPRAAATHRRQGRKGAYALRRLPPPRTPPPAGAWHCSRRGRRPCEVMYTRSAGVGITALMMWSLRMAGWGWGHTAGSSPSKTMEARRNLWRILDQLRLRHRERVGREHSGMLAPVTVLDLLSEAMCSGSSWPSLRPPAAATSASPTAARLRRLPCASWVPRAPLICRMPGYTPHSTASLQW